MSVLDRSKPFGTIYGAFEEVPTARFVQGGRYFNGAGRLITAEGAEAEGPDAEPEPETQALYTAEQLGGTPVAQLKALARRHGVLWTTRGAVVEALLGLAE